MRRKIIGIIGLGNMGEALINQISKTKYQKFIMSEKAIKRKRFIQRSYRVTICKDNQELVREAQIIIIAVKPQDIDCVLNDIKVGLAPASAAAKQSPIIISIAAGISTRYIERKLSQRISVIRVMPNLACKVGKAISCLSKGRFAKERDLKEAEDIFKFLGDTLKVKERFQDIITALSGTGPAYFFYLVESLIKSAKKLGLSEATAKRLAIQTAWGSIHLLKEAKVEPSILRKKVTSKGGTTEAAFKVLDRYKTEKIYHQAILAATKRAKELSK